MDYKETALTAGVLHGAWYEFVVTVGCATVTLTQK